MGARSFTDRFELKSQAGTGGMGTVYQALDRETGELVALKVLQARGMTDAARFDQEAIVLRELRHPGIVRYVDHGVTANGDPYIAMEWLEGETLERRLFRGSLPPRALAALASRVLEALATAHAKAVVHRDIKPSNIYLVGGRIDDVRILDFGIARRLFDPRRFTRVGSMVGTPLYASPEQARGSRDLDGRADVFSLGCVLFEGITGTPPFRAETPQDVLALICTGEVPELRAVCPGLDGELADLVQSMLIQDRTHRPGDALALAERFRRIGERLGPSMELELPVVLLPPPEPSLGEEERRVMVAVRVRFDEPTLDEARAASAARRAVASDALAGLGVVTERLLDGQLVITPAALAPPVDQALLMARVAIRVRELFPEASVGMAMGRASLLAGVPVGPLVDALVALPYGERGSVFVDPAVARLLRDHYRLWEERRQILLVGPLEEREIRSGHAELAAELLGRDRELRTLLALCGESAEEGVARAAIVVAAAGLGKTRLRQTLEARLAESSPEARLCLLRPSRTEDEAEGSYLASVPELAAARASAPMDAARLEAELESWLAARTALGPVVLFAEDLHAADQTSVAILGRALRRFAEAPLVLIAFARPELDELFPGLWSGRHVERTRLLPLSRKVGQALVAAWLPGCAPEVEAFLLERWEGTPFFLRELAGAILASEEDLPDSVLGTVESRLNVVDERARLALRAASLFGDTASAAGVSALLGGEPLASVEALLGALVDRDLLKPAGEPGEYAFSSRLLREACARMLTAADRAVGARLARAFLAGLGRTLPHELLTLTQEEDEARRTVAE
jgi:eukaryotic-like serine/threonine-protein kinase